MARMVDIENGGAFFESLADPRHERNRKHRLVDVIVVAVVGTLCGAAGPTAIRRIAVHRREWLGGFLSLADGIPSRDGIRRVLVHVEPAAFRKRFGLRSPQAFAQRPPSAPGRARRGWPWAGSPAPPNPTKSRRFRCFRSRSRRRTH